MATIRFSVQGAPADLPRWLDLTRRVEAEGYDALLVADHPGFDDPWVALAAAATATSTVRLGTYVAQAGVRSPHHVADSAASLDRFAPGRVILGLGAGHAPAEWAAVGQHDRTRLRASPGSWRRTTSSTGCCEGRPCPSPRRR